MRSIEPKATATCALAQIFSYSFSRSSASSFLESLSPRGMRSGSSTTAAATTGPASGPRPASSQPATGQTPLVSSRRSRRNVGRTTGSASGRRGFDCLAIAHDQRAGSSACQCFRRGECEKRGMAAHRSTRNIADGLAFTAHCISYFPRAPMIPNWLHYLSLASLTLGFFCALVIAIDITRHHQHMFILKIEWPVTALFGGPFAIWGYYKYGRLATHDKAKAAIVSG